MSYTEKKKKTEKQERREGVKQKKIGLWKMLLVQKMCGGWNKMWINIGLPVLLVVIAVQCIESELSREAAFQGKCCL